MPVSKQTASGREIATVKTDVAALGHMLAKVESAISKISETHTEMGKILADLCSPSELEAMADRYFILPMIAEGLSYRKIHEQSQVSITTIGRVARHVHSGHGGYAQLLDDMVSTQI